MSLSYVFIPFYLYIQKMSIIRVMKFIRLEVRERQTLTTRDWSDSMLKTKLPIFFLLGKLDRIRRGGFDSSVHSAPML